MSESKRIPDGVDHHTAVLAIAYDLTNEFRYSYWREDDTAGNLARSITVFNQIRECIRTGTNMPSDFFENLMKNVQSRE